MRRQLHAFLWFLLLGCCCITCSSSALHAEVIVHAALDTTSFAVDEAAQLTITVTGGQSAEVDLPELKGISIERRGQSSQYSMINGSFSSSLSLNYLIQAEKPGKYVIPSLKVKVGKEIQQTLAIPFEVTAAHQQNHQQNRQGTNPKTETSSGETAFLRLSPVQEALYIGEVLPCTIKAYFRQGIRVSLSSLPSLQGDGCVLGPLTDKPAQTSETIDGVAYTVLTWATSLSAVKEGSYTLRTELEATLRIPQRTLSSSIFGRDPFDDDFFANALGASRPKSIHLLSEDTPLKVIALPEGRPKDFSGAVGNFSLETSVSPEQAEVGEPLNMTISISGTGNFDRLEPPPFPESSKWKTYAASPKNPSSKNDPSSHLKIFEQAISARTADVTEIPSLSFSYFDPQHKAYRTAQSKPIPVKIHGKIEQPTTQTTLPPQQAVQEPKQQNSASKEAPTEKNPKKFEGLAPQILEAGSQSMVLRPLFLRPWFMVVLALLLCWLLVLAVLSARKRYTGLHPEQLQQRQRHKELQLALQDLALAESASDSLLFLEKSRRLIQQHLGARLHVEPSALTLSDVRNHLPGNSLLPEIFTLAEQAAFSGVQLSREQMKRYFEALHQELSSIQ